MISPVDLVGGHISGEYDDDICKGAVADPSLVSIDPPSALNLQQAGQTGHTRNIGLPAGVT